MNVEVHKSHYIWFMSFLCNFIGKFLLQISFKYFLKISANFFGEKIDNNKKKFFAQNPIGFYTGF